MCVRRSVSRVPQAPFKHLLPASIIPLCTHLRFLISSPHIPGKHSVPPPFTSLITPFLTSCSVFLFPYILFAFPAAKQLFHRHQHEWLRCLVALVELTCILVGLYWEMQQVRPLCACFKRKWKREKNRISWESVSHPSL